MGTPAAGDLQTRCLLHRFGSQGSTIPPSLECTCLGLAVSGPALLLTLSSCSPGTGHYKPKGPVNVICWHMLQQLPQPCDSPNLGTKAAQAPEM